MIGYLRGRPLSVTPERVLLDVGGVGYEVWVSRGTSVSVEQAGEGPVELHVHTHLREDGIALFGFLTEVERQVFELLITVTGIGPKLARTILSGPSLGDLLNAIAAGDLARLTKTPGVGKKTAERVVLELGDKVKDLAAQVAPVGEAAGPPGSGENVVSALVNLGYKPADAEDAVRAARKNEPEADFHELLRLSLQRLSRA